MLRNLALITLFTGGLPVAAHADICAHPIRVAELRKMVLQPNVVCTLAQDERAGLAGGSFPEVMTKGCQANLVKPLTREETKAWKKIYRTFHADLLDPGLYGHDMKNVCISYVFYTFHVDKDYKHQIAGRVYYKVKSGTLSVQFISVGPLKEQDKHHYFRRHEKHKGD